MFTDNWFTHIKKFAVLLFIIVVNTFFIALTVITAFTFLNAVALPYNEMDRYFDPSNEIVHHKQSVPVYGWATVVFLAVSFFVLKSSVRYIIRGRS